MSKRKPIIKDLILVGERKTRKKFNELSKKVHGQIMRKVLKTAMEPVVPLAKSRAPVGDTHNLQKYIKAATYRKKGTLGAVVQTGTPRQMGLMPGEYYYPSAHEYGSPHRGIPAQSFLRSALFDRKRQVIGIVERELRKILK